MKHSTTNTSATKCIHGKRLTVHCYACERAANSRAVAWGRKETDPCERGTDGCSIAHNVDDGSCETW